MNHAAFSRMLLSFLILNIVTGTVGGALQITVPSFALQLHASTAEIGLIRGMSGIGMLLLVIPAGLLVDQFGARRLFILGSLACACLTFMFSWLAAPIMLIVLQGVLGLFGSLKMTALNAAFFSRVRDMGLARAGWFRGSMSIGLTFVGPLLGGYLDQHLSAGQVFKILGWLALAPTVLVLCFHRESAPVRHGGLMTTTRRQLAALGVLLRNREVYFPLLTECAATGCFATYSAFIVVLTVHTLHRAASTASFLMTLEGGAFILVVFAAGGLITRLTRTQLYSLSAAVTSLGLLVLALANTLLTVALGSGVLGLGLGLFNLVTAARIGQFEGEKGKIVSLFAAAVGIGISVGPMLGGVIGQYFGIRAIFVGYLPIVALLALFQMHRAGARIKRKPLAYSTPAA